MRSYDRYIWGVDKFAFPDCTVYIEEDIIEVWFDPTHRQYVTLSEEAVEALKRGENPNRTWEDGIGNLVCIENSEEVE